MTNRIIVSVIVLIAATQFGFSQKWETTRVPVANSDCLEIDTLKAFIPLGFDESTGISNGWYQLDSVRCVAGQNVWDLTNIRTCSKTQLSVGGSCDDSNSNLSDLDIEQEPIQGEECYRLLYTYTLPDGTIKQFRIIQE